MLAREIQQCKFAIGQFNKEVHMYIYVQDEEEVKVTERIVRVNGTVRDTVRHVVKKGVFYNNTYYPPNRIVKVEFETTKG